MPVHPARIHWPRAGAPDRTARYVLYWVQVNQRARANAALDFAIEEADTLGLPVVVYQGLRPDTPAGNDRIHTFVLEGAFDLARDLEARGILYLFHLERRPAAASGLLATLARDAAMVVTDHFPCFIVPGQTRALARQIERPLAAVEASCIVPAAFFPKAEYAARTLRPKIHRLLPEHLRPYETIAPRRSSLGLDVPYPFAGRGLEADEACWLDLSEESDAAQRVARRASRIADWVASCAIDHEIAPSTTLRGGSRAARLRLDNFVAEKLAGYEAARNNPAVDGTSGLSPYLHFGQIAALDVALAALSTPSASADAFIEQLVVRRELAFNFCEHNPQHASIDALPEWARNTLDAHAGDARPHSYDLGAFERAETDDELWNAAQRELLATGVIHNRLRMLWGKKILEWSDTPADAVRTMIDLHDRYALDGRDPNTYVNILWCLGLHDRPFGPAKRVTGTVRPMSSAIARKAFDLNAYTARVHGDRDTNAE